MAKFLLSVLLSFIGYATHAQQDTSALIGWPAAYEPSKSKFYVHNEIDIQAKPEVVWGFLIDALKWPDWYSGAKQVTFVTANDTVLNDRTIFIWQTMGLKLETAVRQFEPYRLLAWES